MQQCNSSCGRFRFALYDRLRCYSKDSRPATAGSVDVSDEVCVELALCMLMTKFVQDTQGAHGMQYVQASDLEAWAR